MKTLNVILIKPSKYGVDGYVERFEKGFMPNASLYHIASLTPKTINSTRISLERIDEYVWPDLNYLQKLTRHRQSATLLALIGVQSHQFHRALDLAAYAKAHGVEHCVIGGPHPMTCDTRVFHNRGVSFALAEAEVVWEEILTDAVSGELKPVYSQQVRWKKVLNDTLIQPPSLEELDHYVLPMLGLYPMRGCPYRCNYCSVVKIAGHPVRGISIEATLESLKIAQQAGVRYIAFVSDNFNKYPDAHRLLHAMIQADLDIRFFCQCDTHIVNQPELFELLRKAKCFEMFVGVESFNRGTLKAVSKFHNYPAKYHLLAELCRKNGIRAHFSNIIGFPEDTLQAIRANVECLKQLNPAVASFYVLTPIPGTQQYDEYREQGLIWETNLDRFDTTCSVWHHPNLSKQALEDALYQCYVDYYRHLMMQKDRYDEFPEFTVFSRYVASNRMHPMAGGAGKLILDDVTSYQSYRQKLFEIDLAPLPDSLELSEDDQAFNRNKTYALSSVEDLNA